MRKKDYELIAKELKIAYKGSSAPSEIKQLIINFVWALEQASYKFDEQKFLTACGIEVNGWQHAVDCDCADCIYKENRQAHKIKQ